MPQSSRRLRSSVREADVQREATNAPLPWGPEAPPGGLGAAPTLTPLRLLDFPTMLSCASRRRRSLATLRLCSDIWLTMLLVVW